MTKRRKEREPQDVLEGTLTRSKVRKGRGIHSGGGGWYGGASCPHLGGKRMRWEKQRVTVGKIIQSVGSLTPSNVPTEGKTIRIGGGGWGVKG